MEILRTIMDLISGGVALSIILTGIARIVPNSKLHQWGEGLGVSLNAIGKGKMGASWEKIEDFLINSIGVFFSGIKEGLELDEKMDGKSTDNEFSNQKEDKKNEARV